MLKILTTFVSWTLCGLLSTLLFLCAYCRDATAAEWLAVAWHGLRLDVAVAGYLTVLPGLAQAVVAIADRNSHRDRETAGRNACAPSHRPRVLRVCAEQCARLYRCAASALYAVAVVANLALYGFWGFPLDDTGLLYLRTSPRDALASATPWQLALAAAALAALTALFCAITTGGQLPHFSALTRGARGRRCGGHCGRHGGSPRVPRVSAERHGRWWRALSCLALTAALFIPIRGGVSTGTNHTGSVYFSQRMLLNHAAVNPVFSFVEAAAHGHDLSREYRFMPDAEARRLTAPMLRTALRRDSTALRRPDVVIVMLESFSRRVMSVPGVTPRLNALEREGWAFTRFYASSFRTDRAIVATLSGLPAQPTMSVMDLPRKSTRLPSIASALSREGYRATFWYGGDADYSNMRSYLIGTGFGRVVSEDDFPRRSRTGKWGVPDGPLLSRVLQERGGEAPRLDVVMTGSSHEPFDVPHRSRFPEPELNAFHYTDSCLGAFVDGLKKSPRWANTLLVVLPDHLGAWPRKRDEHALWRYELPLIIAGGALEPRRIDTLCCQKDVAATLLGLLGVGHSEFPFSVDALDAAAPHYALFTLNDGEGLVTGSGHAVYDNKARRLVRGTAPSLARRAQALVQRLYDYLAAL